MRTKPEQTSRTVSYSALVKKRYGKEWTRSEVVYRFSNGRVFRSSDRGETGIYKRP